jgi:hypothetical protein
MNNNEFTVNHTTVIALPILLASNKKNIDAILTYLQKNLCI